MKTVTYTVVTFLLKDGEVYITETSDRVEYPVATTDKETSEYFQIPHLERELFVKGAQPLPVDVVALAEERGHFFDAKGGFIDGYNFAMANRTECLKREFTREDMRAAMRIVFTEVRMGNKSFPDMFKMAIHHIRPLSLPKSIQVTDNDWNNPKIVW